MISDVRASEDQGTDPTILDQTFDTKLPLHINDEDIWPGMTEPPVRRKGFTDMTFVVVRYELGSTVRRLSYTPPGSQLDKNDNSDSIAEKERKISDLTHILDENYLQYCDLNVPLQFVTFHVAKLVCYSTSGGLGFADCSEDFIQNVVNRTSSTQACR